MKAKGPPPRDPGSDSESDRDEIARLLQEQLPEVELPAERRQALLRRILERARSFPAELLRQLRSTKTPPRQ
jgi:hypothetical protein